MYEIHSLENLQIGDTVGFEFIKDQFITYQLTKEVNGVLKDKYEYVSLNPTTLRFNIQNKLLGRLNNRNTNLYKVKLAEEGNTYE